MAQVRIFESIQKRVLVTRDSAHLLSEALISAVRKDPESIELDFEGIDAVTPSFVDELMTVLEQVAESEHTSFRIVFVRPPMRLSEKFLAIGRGHGRRMTESGPGSWTIAERSL